MTDDRTLLPPTATPLAKALDALEERLFGLPVQMITKDPENVDVALLDHLAWEHSVDVWDMEWSPATKRRVIAASAEVHRLKGTPHAIRTALSASDVDTELLEWFEPEGISEGLERGSFRVTAMAGRSLYGESENAIDARMVGAMNAVVQRVAPVSRALIFRLGERFGTEACLRSGARAARIDRIAADPEPRPALAGCGPVLRPGLRACRVSRLSHDPAPRAARGGVTVLVATASIAATVSRETHDVLRRSAG